jgi:hypothetical protein
MLSEAERSELASSAREAIPAYTACGAMNAEDASSEMGATPATTNTASLAS